MIARMTESWIFACGFLFLSFRGNAPLFRGIMAHERGRQVFDAGSVEGGGWRIMTVRAMFHICMELWGYFHMPDLRRRNFHCNTTQNQTNSHQNTHADRLHASSWNRRAQLVFSRRCRRNRILYGSHKQFLSILHQLYFHEFLRNLCLVDSEQTSASQTSRIACCLRIIRNWNSLTYHHTIHWSFLLFR